MTDSEVTTTAVHIAGLWTRFTEAQMSAIGPTLRAIPIDSQQAKACLNALFAERGRLADIPEIVKRLRAVAYPVGDGVPSRQIDYAARLEALIAWCERHADRLNAHGLVAAARAHQHSMLASPSLHEVLRDRSACRGYLERLLESIGVEVPQ
ncbi:MAG: hypothetical protein ACK4WH_13095 [Phycisphaerales bacterium]